MKLIKFRIQNYKSIIDSGYCSFLSDLTILIGKNESGKSAILEALRDFDKNVSAMPENVYPLDGRMDSPFIETHFKLDKKDIENIQRVAEVQLSDGHVQHLIQNDLILTKNEKGKYCLKNEYFEQTPLDYTKNEEKKNENEYLNPSKEPAPSTQFCMIKSTKEKLGELLQGHVVPELNLKGSGEEIQKNVSELVKTVKSALPFIKDKSIQDEVINNIRTIIKETRTLNEQNSLRENIQQDFSNEERQRNEEPKGFIDAVVQTLPNFIFFTEFSDILPFKIKISEIKENKSVCDFARIAELDLDKILEITDPQKRINFLNRHSAIISGSFLDYWEQSNVEMKVTPEGDHLLFGINDCDTTDFFKTEQRSKGFQWFLSFYLRLNSQLEKNNIVLIDEPGINLHAKAQQDIIKVLLSLLSDQTQVMFSTHSPYFIDPKHLNRIQIILKSPFIGTKIYQYPAHNADEDTLIPITTAIGGKKVETRPLNVQITLQSSKNVIVRNMATFYFLKAFCIIIQNPSINEINFIPSTDTNHLLSLVSLLVAQESRFFIFPNYHSGNDPLTQQLKEKFLLDSEKNIFISVPIDFSVENLFTLVDFNSFVLETDETRLSSDSNLQHTVRHQINKASLAKSFFDKVNRNKEKICLSEETINSFKHIFKKISSEFNDTFEEEINEEFETGELQESELESPPPKRRSILEYLTGK